MTLPLARDAVLYYYTFTSFCNDLAQSKLLKMGDV